MTSGTTESIDAASPVLEALTRQPGGHSIVGAKCGEASSFKLINQVFCAVQIAMASEAMAFGAKLGLSPRLIYNTARQLGGDSFMRKPPLLTLFVRLSRIDMTFHRLLMDSWPPRPMAAPSRRRSKVGHDNHL